MAVGRRTVPEDDLPELCRIFVEHNGVTNVQIPTNGFLTDKIVRVAEEVLRQCPRINLLVIVSLDDLGAKHDEIRGVKGIYAKAVETIPGCRSKSQRP